MQCDHSAGNGGSGGGALFHARHFSIASPSINLSSQTSNPERMKISYVYFFGCVSLINKLSKNLMNFLLVIISSE